MKLAPDAQELYDEQCEAVNIILSKLQNIDDIVFENIYDLFQDPKLPLGNEKLPQAEPLLQYDEDEKKYRIRSAAGGRDGFWTVSELIQNLKEVFKFEEKKDKVA
jgi:hypothetical protein